ncbi:hypothetical protein C440_04898 [Haloferax mucosum ATCC BAA-1512]|uniref:Uncharacterized protein n=1 Tax=Haloferax mucosum ATCC BAA-1512 TaxID=662479 RepID=M0IK97_9EURY|nr:hypothetical protein [Haloferax mucosum]ELZ96457.1 hypothetical protein C440_04898 [Haloferax mucosum ATCC BAA-1512]
MTDEELNGDEQDKNKDDEKSKGGIGAELLDPGDVDRCSHPYTRENPLWWADLDDSGDPREYIAELARSIRERNNDPEMVARRVSIILGVGYHVDEYTAGVPPRNACQIRDGIIELPDGYDDIRVKLGGVQL